jgi:kinesin family member 6/9
MSTTLLIDRCNSDRLKLPFASGHVQSLVKSLAISSDPLLGNPTGHMQGLSKRTAVSVEEALAMFMAAQHARATAAHGKHSASSRSHFIFTLHCDIRRSGAMTESATASHLHLVDLAGVERYHAQTPAGPPSLATSVYGCREMCSINRSLANLEHVAASLARQQPHVPFRESHLTLVLRDALAGKSHTALIANVWPEEAHVAETVSTLRLVSRMRLVSTVPCQNEASDPDTLLRRYKRQICDLRAELAMRDTLNGRARVHYGDFSTAQEADVSALVARFLAGAIALEDLPLDTVKSIKELLAQCQAAYRTAASAASVAAADMSADPTPGGSAERLEEPGKTGANDPGVGDLAPATGFGIGAAPDSARQPPPAKVRAGSLSPSKAAPSGHCVAASKGACAGGGSSYMAPAVGAGSQHHATADRAPATTMSLPRRPVAIDQQAAFVCFKGCSEAGRAAVAELRAARASSKAARMMTSKEAEQVRSLMLSGKFCIHRVCLRAALFSTAVSWFMAKGTYTAPACTWGCCGHMRETLLFKLLRFKICHLP